MSRRVGLSHRAESDLEELFLYYLGEGGDPLAVRFLKAFDETRATLADYPEIGAQCEWNWSLSGTRILLVQEPFRDILTFYQLNDNRPFILRVVHGSRLQEHLLMDEQ